MEYDGYTESAMRYGFAKWHNSPRTRISIGRNIPSQKHVLIAIFYQLKTSDFMSQVGRGRKLKHDEPIPDTQRLTFKRDPDPSKKVRVTKLIWWVLPSRVFDEVQESKEEERGKALAARVQR